MTKNAISLTHTLSLIALIIIIGLQNSSNLTGEDLHPFNQFIYETENQRIDPGVSLGPLYLGQEKIEVLTLLGHPHRIKTREFDFYRAYGLRDFPNLAINKSYTYYKPIDNVQYDISATLDIYFFDNTVQVIAISTRFFPDWHWALDNRINHQSSYRDCIHLLENMRLFEVPLGDFFYLLTPKGIAFQFNSTKDQILKIFIYPTIEQSYYGGIPENLEASFNRYLDKAQEWWNYNDLQNTLRNYGLALEIYRGSSSTYFEIARAYQSHFQQFVETGDIRRESAEYYNILREIIRFCNLAIQVNNHWKGYTPQEVNLLKGQTYIMLEEYENAIEAYLEVFEYPPFYPVGSQFTFMEKQALMNIVKAYLKMDQVDKAAKFLELMLHHQIITLTNIYQDELLSRFKDHPFFQRMLAKYLTAYGKKLELIHFYEQSYQFAKELLSTSYTINAIQAYFQKLQLRYSHIYRYNYLLFTQTENYSPLSSMIFTHFLNSSMEDNQFKLPIDTFFNLTEDKNNYVHQTQDFFLLPYEEVAFTGFYHFTDYHIQTQVNQIMGNENGTLKDIHILYHKGELAGIIMKMQNLQSLYPHNIHPNIPIPISYFMDRFGNGDVFINQDNPDLNHARWIAENDLWILLTFSQNYLVFINPDPFHKAKDYINDTLNRIINE